MRRTGSFLICLFLSLNVFTQGINNLNYQQDYQLSISRAKGTIHIDGQLNDADWQDVHPGSNFHRQTPTDSGFAKRQTEVRMTYDDNFLYFGITCYDTNYYFVQSLKRDSDPSRSDGIGIVLDPMNSRQNGFLFVLNPYNVQAEDLITANTDNGINFSWNNKWYSATSRQSDRWIAEIAIPFKTIRYEPGRKLWGINFVRADQKNNEYSTWTRVPRNLQFYDFGYTGALVWDQSPPAPGRNISLIPYITGGVSTNPEDREKTHAESNPGIDAKVALTSNLNLDFTINPDFSQVEADQQVTNLTRFDIFFPEKRNFFLENADLFANYGIPPARPFYSRTIGLDKDGNRIPIIAGVRLTGSLGNKTRIGIMNMQTDKKGDFASQNYSAFSVNRTFLKRSLIKAYYFDREASLTTEQKKEQPLERFGRNAGLEFVYINQRGDWQGWGGWHQSWKYGVHDLSHYLNYGAGYFRRKFNFFFNYDGVGTNFYTDMGYVQRIENYDAALDTTIRLGYKSLYISSGYDIIPKKGAINTHRISTEANQVWNPDGRFNERNVMLHYSMRFKNTGRADIRLSNQEIHLLFPTSFTDFDPIPKGNYRFNQFNAEYMSDTRKALAFGGGVRSGDFYNGTLQQLQARIAYRIQPWGIFSVMLEQDKLRFPQPYGNADLFLVAPRVEVSFSNSFSWTTFIQYNTQDNNLNINSRLQWQYKPMSDIFLVYTDNYFNTPFLKNRNRAVVFKMNYWLNL